jgi:hypothetical protein
LIAPAALTRPELGYKAVNAQILIDGGGAPLIL